MLKLWLEYLLTFFKRKKKAVIFLSILLVIFLGLGFFVVQNVLLKNTVSEGIVGTHEERDLPDTVLNLISSGLIKFDKSGMPQPELAEKWEVDSEAKVYKVFLKKDLYWSDGQKVKASDINFSIPDVEAQVIDDNTLQFKLADSFSPFISLLNRPVLRKNSLVGVGPYQVIATKKDGPFLKRMDLVDKDKKLPQVTIKFYPSEKIAKNALKLGEVQSLIGINEINDFQDFKGLKITSLANYHQVVTIFYNTKDAVLSDENFRLALSFGSPAIAGEEEAKTSIPTTSWAFNPTVKDYLDNTDQAKHYLSRVQNGKDSLLVLTVTSGLKSVGERVVEAWNNLGLKATLRVESGIPQNFQALLITQTIPQDPDQYSLWHSTQTETNISKISSPRLDKDLEDGRKLTDKETRKQKYQDFQKTLLDQSPATFLYFPKFNVVSFQKAESTLQKVLSVQLKNFN